MDIEKELAEGLKMVLKIQRDLTDEDSLEERLVFLEEKITAFAKKLEGEPQSDVRLELLAHLCLLSELASGAGFDRLIDAREKFQDLLPDHFSHYLSHLEQSTWFISWSGCLDCRHFSNRCNLNLSPQEDPNDIHRLQKVCSSHVKRSSKL